MVIVAGRLITAYRRLRTGDDFRTNVSRGAAICFEDVPEDGVEFGLRVASACGFEDVGLDVCFCDGRWMVIEANMHYGRRGLTEAGFSLGRVFDELVEGGLI